MAETTKDVHLAEFDALRNEITLRISLQQALLALNVTAVGAIVGVAVSKPGLKELLLVIPVIGPTLGLLWLSHERTIRRIGDYIDKHLWRQWQPSWETHIRSPELSGGPAAFIFRAGIFLGFVVVSAIALAVAVPGRSASVGLWILWSVGLGLTLITATMFRVVDWR
jgi:hypothetical protein